MNPEFRRNLWLELSVQRLVALPVVMFLVFSVATVARREPLDALGLTAASAFLLFTACWGAKQALDSLTGEFSLGTWDTQRASGLTAWEMSWGKLLGGPAFAWYGGGLALAVYAVAESGRLPAHEILRNITAMVAFALLLHGLGLVSGLAAWRKTRRIAAGRNPGAAWLLLSLALLQFAPLLFSLQQRGSTEQFWYGVEWPRIEFLTVSLVIAAFWSVLGLYRLMRAELQFRTTPGAWIGFVLFLMFYCGGFLDASTTDLTPALARLGAALALAVSLAYVTLFGEPKDPVLLDQFARRLHLRELRRALAVAPLWLVSLALAAAVAAAMTLAAPLLARPVQAVGTIAAAWNLLLFAVRDLALVLWLNRHPQPRRADAAAAIYLLVLYVLVPLLLTETAGPAALGLVLPWNAYAQPVWIVAGLVQAAAALDLLRRRWNPFEPPADPAATREA